MKCSNVWRAVLVFMMSIFLLSGCYDGSGKNTTETVAELTTETSEIPATTPATETTKETTPTAVPETVAESETTRETTMAEKDVNWLKKALGKRLGKEPSEVTDEDYLSVEMLAVYFENLKQNEKRNVVIADLSNGKSAFYSFSQSEIPTSIDMKEIAKCKNLMCLDIYISSNPGPDAYIYNYEALEELQKIKYLRIYLNNNVYENKIHTADHITDISFLEKMPNIIQLDLVNIDLPDDLSPIFSSTLQSVALYGCGITEDNFKNLGDTPSYPDNLYLNYNEISDASILTAMQKADGSQVLRLALANNPLTNLGDFLTRETWELNYPGTSHMLLELHGTNFEEYSWAYYMD